MNEGTPDPAGGHDPLTVLERRRAAAALADEAVRLPEGSVQRRWPGDVRVESVPAPDGRDGRTIIYFHGGAFVLGLRNRHRRYALQLAALAAAEVVLVDYRLAPEQPFPAAVDDCAAAYRWVLDERGGDVAVVSDSAGSALAVATMLWARRAGWPPPVGAVFFSPWYDLECAWSLDGEPRHVDPVVDPTELLQFSHLYATGAARLDPLANPSLADLTGFPPMLVMTGEREVLLADASSMCDRARAAQVDCELQIWDGMVHGWQLGGGQPADEARRAAARFLEERLRAARGQVRS